MHILILIGTFIFFLYAIGMSKTAGGILLAIAATTYWFVFFVCWSLLAVLCTMNNTWMNDTHWQQIIEFFTVFGGFRSNDMSIPQMIANGVLLLIPFIWVFTVDIIIFTNSFAIKLYPVFLAWVTYPHIKLAMQETTHFREAEIARVKSVMVKPKSRYIDPIIDEDGNEQPNW